MNVDEEDEDEGEDGLNLALPAKVRWRPRRCDCNKEAAAMKLFPLHNRQILGADQKTSNFSQTIL